MNNDNINSLPHKKVRYHRHLNNQYLIGIVVGVILLFIGSKFFGYDIYFKQMLGTLKSIDALLRERLPISSAAMREVNPPTPKVKNVATPPQINPRPSTKKNNPREQKPLPVPSSNIQSSPTELFKEINGWYHH